MKQADDSLSGPSQLVALFGADDTPLTKLQGALRIGGGYLSAQAAQNLLEQINSGSQAIDLTAVRAGSEAVFNRAVAAQDALQMSNNPIGGLDAGVDETLSWDEDVVRNSDNLMPPRLAITEMGVTREIDTGINQAMAAAAVADLGLPLLLAARGPLQFWETAALRGHLGNAIDRFNVQGLYLQPGAPAEDQSGNGRPLHGRAHRSVLQGIVETGSGLEPSRHDTPGQGRT
jgi:hypothetical protein